MAKLKQRIDINQASLFDILKNYQEENQTTRPAGSFDIDRQFREAISLALKNCPLSRWQVAARMAELTGSEITKAMLDSWTAESKETHRFPAIYLPAFCEAAGCSEPLRMLGKLVGVFVLPGPEALRAEIQRIEEEINRKQTEKRKRLVFLKEMETK
jgi:aspartate aminotransferase-like enzyme